ncbi:MAG: diaminopimelate epimerase [Bacteroidota bacterium]
MKLAFYKYHGTGNDFIIIDNRDLIFNNKESGLVARLCHRRFGIGADGLLLLQNKKGYDFEMVYYNSDGNESSFCGNGSRCIIAFAKKIGILKTNNIKFFAIDGEHEAKIKRNIISVKMNNVNNVEVHPDYLFINTGSPHFVSFVSDVKKIDVLDEGRKIRNSKPFKKEGVNVNFVEKKDNFIFVRTYERGVEDETLSCGTGVVASALAAAMKGISTAANQCKIKTLGGELRVSFKKQKGNSFSDIWMEGHAIFVFNGEIK